MDEIFAAKTVGTRLQQEKLKELEIPVRPRKTILEVCEGLRRGVVTFEYLEKRIIQDPKKKAAQQKAAELAAAKAKAEAAKKK